MEINTVGELRNILKNYKDDVRVETGRTYGINVDLKEDRLIINDSVE